MSTFIFTDSQGRVYSNLNGGPLVAVPGKAYELESDPADGRWELKDPETAPEAPVAPAKPAPEPTN